ncbi:chaplin family protein [Streptomyces lavendulocolor]|uniref:chaplin family protein n=1 Tax=Streptomyces lavendulocolor TaxID=67316 RepID=UPI003C2EB676
MTMRKITTALAVTAAGTAAALGTTTPAAAGGVGDFLSPAFGTMCGNLNNGAHAVGSTTSGPGSAGGNLAGLPIGNPVNQCGGADLTPSSALFNLLNEAH